MDKLLFNLFRLILLVFAFGIGREMLALSVGAFGEGGVNSIVSMAAALAIVLMSLFMLSFQNLRAFSFGFPRLIIIWSLLIILPVLVNDQRPSFLIRVELWPMSFLLIYMFVRYDPRRVNSLVRTFVLLFFIGLFFFLQSKFQKVSIEEEGMLARSNVIYNVLLTIPWILLIKNGRYKFFFILIVSLAVMYSGKRSTFLILILSLLPLLYSVVNNIRSRFQKVLLLSCLGLIVLGGLLFVNSRMDNLITNRLESIEEDQGSGRLLIYEHVISLQSKSSVAEWIFGHGHMGVRRDSYYEMSAHNEFLEVLYDYGIIVFLLYCVIYFFLIKRLINLFRIKSEYFIPYYMSVCIFVVMSMVSHLIIYSTYFIYLILFWGAIEGLYVKGKLCSLYEY